jgi:autotransporter-associated beta strand protein
MTIATRDRVFSVRHTTVLLLAALVCLLLVDVGSARADQCEWTGRGDDNNWSTEENWSCTADDTPDTHTIRTPTNDDTLLFADSSRRSSPVNNIVGLSVTQVTIAELPETTGGWNITAAPNDGDGDHTLTVTGEIDVAVDHAASFLVPIKLVTSALGETRTIGNRGNAPLTLGAIEISNVHLSIDIPAPITVSGVISGTTTTLGVIVGGATTLTLAGDNSYSGRLDIFSGTVIAAGSHAFGVDPANLVALIGFSAVLSLSDGVTIDQPLSISDGALLVPVDASAVLAGHVDIAQPGTSFRIIGTLTVSGQLTGTVPFEKFDAGTLILTNGTNTISEIVVDAGTLRLGAAGALPATAAVDLLSQSDATTPTTLDLNGHDQTLSPLFGDEGSRVLLGPNTLTVNMPPGFATSMSGTIAGSGNLIVKGVNGLFTLDGAPPNTFTGTTSVQGGQLILAKTVVNATILGPLVVNGGSVRLAASEQIADQAPVTVTDAGVLFFENLTAKETVGSLSGNGAVSVHNGTLTVGANNTSTTFGGTITGDRLPVGNPQPQTYFRLVKTGNGVLTLTGNNTPGDQIVVDSGTLIVDGRSNGSGVLVRGGVLGGTGTFLNEDADDHLSGSEIASTGGAISPGHSPGVLHGDAAQIAGGGSLMIELNGTSPGSGYDQLALTQSLTLSNVTLVVTRGFAVPVGSTFTIVDLPPGGFIEGTFDGLPEGATFDVNHQRFQISYQGGPDHNDVVLTALADATPPPPPPPLPPTTYYLSEGATGAFFDEDILIANPNGTDAPVTITFSKEDGSQVVDTRTVPAKSRMTVHVDQIAGLEAVTGLSAQVTSTNRLPLVVERSMFWDAKDAKPYAGSTGSSVDAPAADWFFAEGSQTFFHTFVLINNPNATPTDVTFTFFRESQDPVVKTVTVGATTRLTLDCGRVPEIVGSSFGISVHATQPIMAERSVYFDGRGNGQLGGTESAGVTAPSTHWFLAEGATGGFFNTFILVSNPNNTPANVTFQYLLPGGDTVTVQKTIGANLRLTTNVQGEDARLHDTAVSTVVTSDVPVIAERSMYWPGPPEPIREGHNSFGVTDGGLKWGLAEGRTGTPLNYHTFILLANAEKTAANVKATFLREGGAAPIVKTYTVAPTSRFNIDSADDELKELHDETFGVVIEVTNNVPIIVERSMYWDANGVSLSGGTNATGIRLP